MTVTEAALHLAERELSLAQDRFRNGVTDNIEVVTAQASLASAQDDRIMPWRSTPTPSWRWPARWGEPRRFTKPTSPSPESSRQ